MNHPRKTAAITAATIALLALTACGGPSSASTPEASTAPATFTAKGTLRKQTVPRWAAGENCDSGNFGTINEGSEVKIVAKGNTVAMGTIKKHGVMESGGDSHGYFCDYELSVENVPAGMGFYTVDFGGRVGHKEFTEQALKDGMTVETTTFQGEG